MQSRLAIVLLSIALALAGCAGAGVGLRSGDSSAMRSGAPPPGTSYGSAAIRAEVSPSAYFGMVVLGGFMLGVHEDFGRSSAGASWRAPPGLAEGRAIAERDCRQPLGQLEGNLRCK